MFQVIQICGSLAILVPFVLVQLGRQHTKSKSFVVSNLIGSAILATEAVVVRQWGIALLETFWAAASLASMTALTVRRG